MPSAEEQKKLKMQTSDGRWGLGDKVCIKGTEEWGTVFHCDGNRVEVALDYSITKGSHIIRKKRSTDLEHVQTSAQRRE